MFENLIQSSVTVTEFSSVDPGQFKIEFKADTRDHDATIYQVKTIEQWTNLSSNPTKVRYVGDPYVLYNHVNDCARGLVDTTRNSIEKKCTEHNHREGSFSSWQTDKEGNPFFDVMATQVIETWPDAIVYCPGRIIKL